jgi:tetratricopeptide (TPR) repeat protein
MPISQTDQLFKLIKSLTKSEKRNFTLYAKRISSSDKLKFIQLFEFVDKQKILNDKIILSGLGDIGKNQLSNLKRHLYTQIMTSLRMIHIKKNSSIQVREYYDFAKILYGKGLYLQSLKIVKKAQNLAKKNGYDIMLLTLIEFRKLIEARHITRTGAFANNELTALADQNIDQVSVMIKLSNLRLMIHGEYIKYGHVKDQQGYQRVRDYFDEHLPEFDEDSLGFISKSYLYQSFVWLYYIQLDFKRCYEAAVKWVNASKDFPQGIDRDPDLFMRGYHYMLTSVYNISVYNEVDHSKYLKHLEEIEAFRKKNYNRFNDNSKIISFMYVHHGRLNKYFLTGEFAEGVKVLPRTIRRINRYRTKLDDHRILVFYFKIAWMYFGNNQPDMTIQYLNKITNHHIENLRSDLQGYSRLLFLMAHYDLQNYDIMDYVYKRVKRFYDNYQEKNAVQESVLVFFKKVITLPASEHHSHLKKLRTELLRIKDDPFEIRPFLYLNFPAWVEAKILNKPMADIISQKLRQPI